MFEYQSSMLKLVQQRHPPTHVHDLSVVIDLYIGFKRAFNCE